MCSLLISGYLVNLYFGKLLHPTLIANITVREIIKMPEIDFSKVSVQRVVRSEIIS